MLKNETWTDPTKSHVGIELCWYCGKDKGIILDRRMRKSLPMQAVYNHEPCPECAENMQQGIMIIEVRDGEKEKNPDDAYRTGRLFIVNEEAFLNCLNKEAKELGEQIVKARFVLIEQHVCLSMGLPPPGDNEK